MKCESCSNEVKPVVAIDIDGTLGDYHGHFTWFWHVYHGVHPLTALDMAAQKRYDGSTEFYQFFCDDKEYYRKVKLAYRQGGLKRSMPVYMNAHRMFQEIHNAGAAIWIATTRPYLRLDNIDPDTRWWLANQGLNYEGMIYDGLKYELLPEFVDKDRVVMVLDDLPEQIEMAKNVFGGSKVVWRRQTANSGAPRPTTPTNGATSLRQATAMAVDRINRWKEQHA